MFETLTMTLIGIFRALLKQQGTIFFKENLIYVVGTWETGMPQGCIDDDCTETSYSLSEWEVIIGAC